MFGPTISTTTGQEILGSDEDSTFAGVAVGSSPVAIANVFYDISAAASTGTFTVMFDPGGTSLTDGISGAPYTTVRLPTASITITNVVPEPASLVSALVGVTLARGWAASRRSH